jgi:hypothetical protein
MDASELLRADDVASIDMPLFCPGEIANVRQRGSERALFETSSFAAMLASLA